MLLIGAVVWAYLGIIFEILTETVAWERWEGTIEYTFMAPLSRPVHLFGMGLFAVAYGVVRASAALRRRRGVLRAVTCPTRTSRPRCCVLAVASVSFIGIGMMTAVLPLISPEKGTQLGFVAQGLMLVVSGVYYPVACCRSGCSGSRRSRPRPTRCAGSAPRSSTGRVGALWADIWPLLVIGAVVGAARARRLPHAASSTPSGTGS